MTPVAQHLLRVRRPPNRLPRAVLGVVLLVLLFAPSRDAATHGLSVEWRPSAELAFLIFLVAIAAVAHPQLVMPLPTARILGLLVTTMALLNLIDAAPPALLGRDLNLYWDLRHLPSLFGLAGEAAGFWWITGAICVAAGAVFLLMAVLYRIWRRVFPALTDRRVGLALAILLGIAVDITAFMPPEGRPLAIR